MELPPVVVSASTSNLGPGFDAIGLAFEQYLTVRVLDVDERRTGGLTCRFIGPPPEGENLIDAGYRAFGEAAAVLQPHVIAEVVSDIPVRAGLGSSAAALVAGLKLGECFAPGAGLSLLDLGTRLEGHPDNVSAALLGGWTTSVVRPSGQVLSRSHPWPERFKIVVATPVTRLATRVARAVLAADVTRRDAVFNLQRVAMLVDALTDADAEALAWALDDRLHQPARCAIIPGLAAALRLEHPELIGTFLSGAGPSVIAICDGETDAVAAQLRATYDAEGVPASIATVRVRQPASALTERAAARDRRQQP